MYQYLPSYIMGSSESIKRVSDGATIPFEPTNIDYQEYLQWLSEGNTPLPADE
jgi:hypothetical protein